MSLLWQVCQPVSARVLRDYAIDSWTTRHGLPHNSLRDIAQTPDGQLWMATWEGLVRYNGLEFSTFDRSTRPGLLDNGLGSLHVDAKGQLWMGDSRGNVLRYDGKGNWKSFVSQPPAPGVLIQAMRTDDQGRLWLLYEGKGLGYLDESGSFHFTPPPDDVSMVLTYPRMEIDAQEQIWIGTLDGLVLRGADGVLRPAPASFGLAPGPSWPYRAADGVMWVVNGDAVYRVEQGVPRLYHRFEGIQRISEMLVDRHGQIWVGSESEGVMRLNRQGKVERLAEGDQPSGRILSLFEDREGSIWIGANGGLFRAREALFSSLTTRDGLGGDYLRALLEDGKGQLWVGGPKGLDRITGDGTIVPVELEHQDDGRVSVLSLALASDGAVWVGTYGHGVYRIDADGRQRNFVQAQTLTAGNVRALIEDESGAMWVGSQGGLLRIVDGRVERVDLPGMPRELIISLHRHERELWIGSTEGVRRLVDGRVERIPVFETGGARTVFGFRSIGSAVWLSTDRGLYRHKDGQIVHLGIEKGVPVDTIFQITPDQMGNVWLSTNRGVFRTDQTQLEALANGQRQHIPFERFTEMDGLVNAQGNGSSGPVAILRADGSYWMVTAGGLVSVHPRRLQQFRDRMPPAAIIEDVTLDGEGFNWQGSELAFPSGGRLSVSFVGLSYLLSERITYRTRVVGLDSGWVERGTHRHVEFVGLPPGSYTLQVQASHPGGSWQGNMAELPFTVTPLWWQRSSVWVVIAVLGLFLAHLVHRYSIWRYKEQARRLSEQVQQRTLDIQYQAERLLAANQEKNILLQKMREQAESFERQAHEDALTGLANRRAFNETLGREFARFQRSEHPLCLVVLDIDHFKSINDRFTHTVGDLVLAEVGELLRTACREADMAARLGGEEFALLLPDTRVEAAELICLRLKEMFAERSEWAGIQNLRVTFSAGLVQAATSDKTAHSLYQRADSALYKAKNSGRDLTCVG